MSLRILSSRILAVAIPVLCAGAWSGPASGQTPLKTELVVSGLNSPVAIVAPPDGSNRLFFVTQTGRIRVYHVDTQTLKGKAFLVKSTNFTSGGERGLLGLAFHPDYKNNGYFYINYTDASGDTVVERFTVSAANPDVADDTSGVVILGPLTQWSSNHNGGNLAFGPDGYLYIGMGDGGGAGDPGCRAQNGGTLMGKMLRIDVDGGFPYAIPPSNPFVSDPNFADEIWAYGLRNPWRFSFDRETGDLWIGDVGQNTREEINFQPAASTGGENYGWKMMEGTNCYGTSGCTAPPPCNDASLTDPIRDYGTGSGRCVTGGFVYRGCAIPDLQGTYFYADYSSNRIWSFRYNGASITDFTNRTTELAPGGGLDIRDISTFGEDQCGELYLADINGEIFKIVPDAPAPATDLGFGKVGSNGLTPKLSMCGLLDAGNFAVTRLEDAPPSTVGFLFTSLNNNPSNGLGGTLVPVPALVIFTLTTDANGEWNGVAPGGLGPVTVYMQFLLSDPLNSFGAGFSNALQVDWL